MEAAVWNNVPGIEAVCGGAMACSTCLVQVPKEWHGKLGSPSVGELELIAGHHHASPDSRLSCQLRVEETFDGLILELPPEQQ